MTFVHLRIEIQLSCFSHITDYTEENIRIYSLYLQSLAIPTFS